MAGPGDRRGGTRGPIPSLLMCKLDALCWQHSLQYIMYDLVSRCWAFTIEFHIILKYNVQSTSSQLGLSRPKDLFVHVFCSQVDHPCLRTLTLAHHFLFATQDTSIHVYDITYCIMVIIRVFQVLHSWVFGFLFFGSNSSFIFKTTPTLTPPETF